MSNVFWRRKKPDHDGVVWNDLRDPAARILGVGWVITYREYYGCWHVMWNTYVFRDKPDRLINKNIPEEQLRIDLKLQYLFQRGETNNVR